MINKSCKNKFFHTVAVGGGMAFIWLSNPTRFFYPHVAGVWSRDYSFGDLRSGMDLVDTIAGCGFDGGAMGSAKCSCLLVVGW